jgi:SET domain
MYKSIRLGVILSKSPDLEAYMKWGYENGITMNKLVYPVRFPPGYIGTMALEQINPGEIIGSVPNSLLFSSKKAEESELSGLFQEKNFFFNKGDPNYEDMVLITYFIWEKFKGKSSKWYYFIKNQPESPETLQDWSIEELQQLQDEDLIYDTKRALESTIRVWESWKNAVASSGLFSPSMVEYKEFFIVYRLLSSRTFSKFVPYKTFGPIIEYLNHHNMSTTYYYGDKTIQHAVEGARRYERFRDGDDYDSELITEKPVYRPTCQRLLELKNLNIDAQKSFSKLLKEAEDIDNSDKLYLEQKKIWTPQVIQESEDKNLMIITGNEIYESGSEVYLTYGRDSNRTLLATYGFALQNNCYDYASLRIPLHKLCTKDKAHQVEAKDKSRIYEFKFKSNFCCKGNT